MPMCLYSYSKCAVSITLIGRRMSEVENVTRKKKREKEFQPITKAWPILIFHPARETRSLHSLNSNLVMAEVHVVCRLQHQAALIPSVSLSG